VREYTESHYLSAAAAYRERAADQAAAGRQIVAWRHAVDAAWSAVRFGAVRVDTSADRHAFEVEVCLQDLDPGAVSVELFANGGDGPYTRMYRAATASNAAGAGLYRANVSAARPAADYTARIVARHAGVAVPLECGRIRWQR
jgi:starch phosphorylase